MEKNFGIATEIFYGPHSIQKLNTLEMEKVCIVTDPYMVKFGLLQETLRLLEDRKIPCHIFDKVKPDPTLGIVTEGVRHLVDTKPDVVIAIGGGSVIDTAKAIIYLDYRLQEKIVRKDDIKKTKLIAIPTTSGTGSEVTSYSVITNEENNRKIPLVDKRMIPDIAVLDPNFTRTVPPKVVAESGLDVFTHALEAYVSKFSNPFSRGYAVEALKLVRDHLVPMFLNISQEEHRTNMHIASCMAGLAFEQSSLGLTHGMAHSLGGHFYVAHGLCNGILLNYIIEYNVGLTISHSIHEENLKKYSEVAEVLGIQGESPLDKVMKLLNTIREIKKQLGVPENIQQLGIPEEQYFQEIPSMAKATMEDRTLEGNPREASMDDVLALYQKVYKG